MESFLKNIFAGKSDESAHNEFIKFSKGIFTNRYLMQAKKQKSQWAIKTSSEFANFLVSKCLEKTHGEIAVKGLIVCTFDLKDEIPFEIEKVKQFMGVKQYVINTKVNAQKLLDLTNKFPRVFYALSFSTPNCDLKIKPKMPKSGKPSTKAKEEPKADFCSLKTNEKEIIDDLFFDFPNFKEIFIKHTIKIDEIILPQGIDDPKKMRELAKRKGQIIREISIDKREEKKQADFEV